MAKDWRMFMTLELDFETKAQAEAAQLILRAIVGAICHDLRFEGESTTTVVSAAPPEPARVVDPSAN